MPNRILHEDIRVDRVINSLSDREFRLLMHLVTYVDDFGRGVAEPEVLCGMAEPRLARTKPGIEADMLALAQKGIVRLYTVRGEKYLELNRFTERQRCRSMVSKYPGPEAAQADSGVWQGSVSDEERVSRVPSSVEKTGEQMFCTAEEQRNGPPGNHLTEEKNEGKTAESPSFPPDTAKCEQKHDPDGCFPAADICGHLASDVVKCPPYTIQSNSESNTDTYSESETGSRSPETNKKTPPEEMCKEVPPQEPGPEFAAPTVQEVREYGELIGAVIDVGRFVDYYESIGWKVHGNRIVDWKARYRTWVRGKRGDCKKAEKKPEKKPDYWSGDGQKAF